MRDAPFMNRQEANAARIRRTAYTRNANVLELVRSELDTEGRIVRAFIGRYELVRTGAKWAHVDRFCPYSAIGCVHTDALYQLDAEAGR